MEILTNSETTQLKGDQSRINAKGFPSFLTSNTLSENWWKNITLACWESHIREDEKLSILEDTKCFTTTANAENRLENTYNFSYFEYFHST